jgi:4-hydroxy-4-methyl-2-oxoglutarate aldolase
VNGAARPVPAGAAPRRTSEAASTPGGEDTGIATRLAALSTSLLSDTTGGAGVLAPGLTRFSGTGTVAGRAVTADCAEGSLMAALAALDHARPGDVLVMTAPGPTAYLGDLLAAALAGRGVVAAVVDGLVRDSDAIAATPVSIFARGVTPVARRGQEPGRVSVPISVAGVRIRPGDWIVADGDGVVVIAPDDVEAVLARAEEAARHEERIMERIRAGATVADAVRSE